MTIVVTYTDGTVDTFSSVTGFADDGVSIKFNGQLQSQSSAIDWVLTKANVRKYSKVTTGS